MTLQFFDIDNLIATQLLWRITYPGVMKTLNNRSTLVNKFQGFSSASDDDDRVDRIASCTTSDNRWYRRTSGCGPKEVSACSRQPPRSIPQAAAFTSSSVSFFAKDCAWILLYDVSLLDVKKELTISSDSSRWLW